MIGGLSALPMLPKGELRKVVMATFTGTPLHLAAVLVTVGILVQIMTLTGVRGWLVISTMTLTAPWNYVSLALGMPLLGGALTSMSVSDVIGVPAAFSFIGQDMILNVVALSAVASLAEFVPPTAIAAALSCYVVGGGNDRPGGPARLAADGSAAGSRLADARLRAPAHRHSDLTPHERGGGCRNAPSPRVTTSL